MAATILHNGPGLLAASLALGAATALLPVGPHQQYTAAVALLAGTRAFAAWWNAAWHGSGPQIAYSTWLMHCSYALCSIIRSRWDAGTISIMEHWVQPAVAGCQFAALAAHGSLDWASRRKQLHWPQLLLMNTAMAILAAYPSWAKCASQNPPCSYIDYAIPAVLWATLGPIILIEVLPKVVSMAVAAINPRRNTLTVVPPASLHSQLHSQAWLPAVKAALSWLGLKECGLWNAHLAQRRPANSLDGRPSDGKPEVLYQSAFGPHIRASVKIHGPLQLPDLPHDLPRQLQGGLEPVGLHLLRMAARSGCVCLSLDLLSSLLPAVRGAAGLPQGCANPLDPQDPEDPDTEAWKLAEVLLLSLDAAMAGSLQPRGTCSTKHDITMQVGSTRLTARWDAIKVSWQLTLAQASPPSPPRLGLGYLQQLPGTSWALSPTQQGASYPAPAPGRNSNTSPAVNSNFKGTADQAVQLHTVRVLAQLMTSEASAPITTSELSTFVGWEPVVAPGHHEQVDPSAFRLLACCGSTFVSTHVLEVLEPALEGHHPAVKVELQVPDKLLPRHHVDGPPVGLAPLVLELWQGDSRLSTASLLLHLPCPGGLGATAVPCWWWGSTGSTVQLAVHELQQLAAVLADSTAASAASCANWQAFQEDLMLWLEQVRRVAIQSGLCTAGQAVALVSEPVPPEPVESLLSPARMLTASHVLVTYSRAHGMKHTVKMLQQQQHVMRAWAQQQQRLAALPPTHVAAQLQPETPYTPTLCSHSPQYHMVSTLGATPRHSPRSHMVPALGVTARHTTAGRGQAVKQAVVTWRDAHDKVTWRDVHDALVGSSCEQCEVLRGDAVVNLLNGIQASAIQLVISGALAVSGLVRVLVCAQRRSFGESSLILIWALLRLQLFTQQVLLGRAAGCSTTSRPHQLLALAYCSRLATHLLIGAGVIETQTRLKLVTILANYVVLTLAEQAQVSLLMRPPQAALLTSADLLIYLLLCARIGSARLWLVLLLLPAAWLPRLVPDVLLRAKLRAKLGNASDQISDQIRASDLGPGLQPTLNHRGTSHSCALPQGSMNGRVLDMAASQQQPSADGCALNKAGPRHRSRCGSGRRKSMQSRRTDGAEAAGRSHSISSCSLPSTKSGAVHDLSVAHNHA